MVKKLHSKEELIGMAWASGVTVDEAIEFLTDNGYPMTQSEMLEYWVRLDDGSARHTLDRL
jgi:hypothetical protein